MAKAGLSGGAVTKEGGSMKTLVIGSAMFEMLMKLAAVFSVSTDYMLGLESGEYLDVSDLPKDVIAHIRQIVDDLRAK